MLEAAPVLAFAMFCGYLFDVAAGGNFSASHAVRSHFGAPNCLNFARPGLNFVCKNKGL